MAPVSMVKVIMSKMFSSLAIEATPSGMPTPRLTMELILRNMVARLAMTLRTPKGMGWMVLLGTRISPV